MNAKTIVTMVLTLSADGQTPDQIAAVLTAMGFASPTTTATRPNGQAANRPGNPLLLPSRAYRIVHGMTAQRIAAMGLPASEQQVAALLLTVGKPLGRREITERLQHGTKKITESLVHKMRTRGIIESVDGAQYAPQSAENPLAALVAAEATPRRSRKPAKRR